MMYLRMLTESKSGRMKEKGKEDVKEEGDLPGRRVSAEEDHGG